MNFLSNMKMNFDKNKFGMEFILYLHKKTRKVKQ